MSHCYIAKLFICFICICACFTGKAQQQLFGRIIKQNTQEVLAGVTLQNLAAKKYNKSDAGGNYRIAANAGDSIIFSSAGYKSDTVVVNDPIPSTAYDIFLIPNVVVLPGVEIDELNKYETDSVQRRIDYAFIFDPKHPVKLMNEKREGDAPGLNFSPVGYFSKRERQKRQLKKQVIQEDRDEYVDARFPRSKVALLTKLEGDSLQQFMLRYRPSYEFCRLTDNQQMLLYINDKVVLFRRGKRK